MHVGLRRWEGFWVRYAWLVCWLVGWGGCYAQLRVTLPRSNLPASTPAKICRSNCCLSVAQLLSRERSGVRADDVPAKKLISWKVDSSVVCLRLSSCQRVIRHQPGIGKSTRRGGKPISAQAAKPTSDKTLTHGSKEKTFEPNTQGHLSLD